MERVARLNRRGAITRLSIATCVALILSVHANAQEDLDDLAPLMPVRLLQLKVKGLTEGQSLLRHLKFANNVTLVLALPHQVLVNGAVQLESKSSPSRLKVADVRCSVAYRRGLKLQASKKGVPNELGLEIKTAGEMIVLEEPTVTRERAQDGFQVVFATFPIQDALIKSFTCSKRDKAPAEFSTADLAKGMFGSRSAAFTIVEEPQNSALPTAPAKVEDPEPMDLDAGVPPEVDAGN